MKKFISTLISIFLFYSIYGQDTLFLTGSGDYLTYEYKKYERQDEIPGGTGTSYLVFRSDHKLLKENYSADSVSIQVLSCYFLAISCDEKPKPIDTCISGYGSAEYKCEYEYDKKGYLIGKKQQVQYPLWSTREYRFKNNAKGIPKKGVGYYHDGNKDKSVTGQLRWLFKKRYIEEKIEFEVEGTFVKKETYYWRKDSVRNGKRKWSRAWNRIWEWEYYRDGTKVKRSFKPINKSAKYSEQYFDKKGELIGEKDFF